MNPTQYFSFFISTIYHDMVHALLLVQTLHHYSHFPTSILFTSSAFFGGHFISLLSLMRSSLSACENPWKNSTKICTYRKEPTCIKNYTIDSRSSQTTSFFYFSFDFSSSSAMDSTMRKRRNCDGSRTSEKPETMWMYNRVNHRRPEKLWVRYFDEVGSHNFKLWLDDDDSHSQDEDKDTDGSGTKIESRILLLH